MAQIDIIKQRFNDLCSHKDFIQAFNDFNGTQYTKLNISQLFAVGSLFHFVKVKMYDQRELLLTDAFYDVTYEGKTYLAAGDFVDISTIKESKEINNIGMNVTLGNVRTEYINLIRTKSFNNADVQIDIGFLNPNTGSVETSFNIFTGVIDSMNINIQYEDNESKNETEVVMNSIWEALDKTARNHASSGVHRSYPGNENDTFFDRIGKWNSEQKWTSKK